MENLSLLVDLSRHLPQDVFCARWEQDRGSFNGTGSGKVGNCSAAMMFCFAHVAWDRQSLFLAASIFHAWQAFCFPVDNNWRASCKKLVRDFLGQIFVLVQMSSIFACDLGLNGKTLPGNFFCCFVFRFQEIFLNQHWQQMSASPTLFFGKTKAFFGKDTARKKTAFLHTLFMEKERETSKLK